MDLESVFRKPKLLRTLTTPGRVRAIGRGP